MFKYTPFDLEFLEKGNEVREKEIRRIWTILNSTCETFQKKVRENFIKVICETFFRKPGEREKLYEFLNDLHETFVSSKKKSSDFYS